MLVKYPQDNISPDTLRAIGINMVGIAGADMADEMVPSLPSLGYALESYLDGAEGQADIHIFVDPFDLAVKDVKKMPQTGRVLQGKSLETWLPNLKCIGLLSAEACEWAVGEVASYLDGQLPTVMERIKPELERDKAWSGRQNARRQPHEVRAYDFDVRVSHSVASSVARAISAGLYSPADNG